MPIFLLRLSPYSSPLLVICVLQSLNGGTGLLGKELQAKKKVLSSLGSCGSQWPKETQYPLQLNTVTQTQFPGLVLAPTCGGAMSTLGLALVKAFSRRTFQAESFASNIDVGTTAL